MAKRLGSRTCNWLRFLGGVLLMVFIVLLVHTLSPSAGGPAGQVFLNNERRDFDASALFYTETGRVADYLDEKKGRYHLGKSGK